MNLWHLTLVLWQESLPAYLYCEPDKEKFEPGTLIRRLVHVNKTLDQFWKHWRREYLLELRQSHCYHCGNANPSQVSVGEVVIVHPADQWWGYWRLGRVQKVLVGRDEKVRGAVFRVAGKGHRAKLLQCPLQLFYPSEICTPPCETEQSESELHDSEQSASVTVSLWQWSEPESGNSSRWLQSSRTTMPPSSFQTCHCNWSTRKTDGSGSESDWRWWFVNLVNQLHDRSMMKHMNWWGKVNQVAQRSLAIIHTTFMEENSDQKIGD